jgi:methylmalonyl-CoA/ethylmalonyl-CoA epimerase
VTPHHVGCAVRDLETSSETYRSAFGLERRTRAFDVTSQQVRVCFLELQPRFYLELLSPLDGAASLVPFLRVGFYHLCFLVDDLETARAALTGQRFSALPPFRSEAFAGAPTQFFVNPQLHLIELAQMSPQDFDAFFVDNLRRPQA